MIVLDTTVLVYALGTEHELREPCKKLMRAIAGERIAATTTSGVIQEFAHVRSRRRSVAEAVESAHEYVEMLSPLLVSEPVDLDRGLSIFESIDGLGAFDSVLAAAAIRSGSAALVSGDRAFGRVPGMDHVFPDRVGIATILD